MIRVTYEKGNGYQCYCCRSTYTDYEDFGTLEEVKEEIAQIAADKTMPRWEDADDVYVERIELGFGEEIELSADPVRVKEILAERTAEEEVKDKQRAYERKLSEEQRERVELARLKAKYEEDDNDKP